jgi:UDP-2,3-diacylglucosamine hydrolase
VVRETHLIGFGIANGELDGRDGRHSVVACAIRPQYTAPVPETTAVIVADAHLAAGGGTREAFLRFLASVPTMGGHLVINGDLFDMWFEYGTVIPRSTFPVLSALHGLVRDGIAVTVTGGNHDRWGGPFWRDDVGAAFHPGGARLALAGLRADVRHGDGIAETHATARAMHRVTRWPATVAAFRWLHPDVGLRLAEGLSGRLARKTRDGPVLERAAAAQARWARDLLAKDPAVDLVVLGHTHRPALEAVAPRRWYLNPGAWCDGQCYAVVTPDGPELRTY